VKKQQQHESSSYATYVCIYKVLMNRKQFQYCGTLGKLKYVVTKPINYVLYTQPQIPTMYIAMGRKKAGQYPPTNKWRDWTGRYRALITWSCDVTQGGGRREVPRPPHTHTCLKMSK